jgi:hypothetical protein
VLDNERRYASATTGEITCGALGMVAEDESVSTAPYRVDTFHALLSTLASALDVRDVFRRLSAVAARLVPHDEANLALLTEDGATHIYAIVALGVALVGAGVAGKQQPAQDTQSKAATLLVRNATP